MKIDAQLLKAVAKAMELDKSYKQHDIAEIKRIQKDCSYGEGYHHAFSDIKRRIEKLESENKSDSEIIKEIKELIQHITYYDEKGEIE